MICDDKDRDIRGISLAHVVPLSRGGKTNKGNCLLLCGPCHERYEKKPDELPKWVVARYLRAVIES